MNVYDFDGTIYNGDSTFDFYFYLLKKRPVMVLKQLPMLKLLIKYTPDFINKTFDNDKKTKLKEKFYLFLKAFNDNEIEKCIIGFWESHKEKIFDYYKNNHKDTDVIISASPYFLLEPICKELKVGKLIASNVDRRTGSYDGINCWGKEKVKRFIEIFNDTNDIDKFYSDSYSDTPLADVAKKAYMVDKQGKIHNWNEQENLL